MTTKLCSRCREVLPVERFARDAHRRDGLRYQCRTCYAAMMREYRYRKGLRRRPDRTCENCGAPMDRDAQACTCSLRAAPRAATGGER